MERIIEASLPKIHPSPSVSEELHSIRTVGEPHTFQSDEIKSFLRGQKPIELNALITDTELARIKKNPWEINLTATLKSFHKRIYKNPEIKFRVGGRVISSASQIVRAKAKYVIQESQETQDQLTINEVDDLPDDDEFYGDDYQSGDGGSSPHESMSSILLGLTQGRATAMEEGDQISNEELRAYRTLRDAELAKDVPTDRFFSVNREGQHFLASPVREVFRKIDFGDLNTALIQTLKRQLRQPSRRQSDPFKKHIPKILADNILAKAKEDRARVEEQIKKMHSRILNLFKEGQDQPIAFLTLIVAADPDGIVRTLLYLLQLVNRKHVELWQKIPEEDDTTSNSDTKIDTGLDIFVTPASSRSPSEIQTSKK